MLCYLLLSSPMSSCETFRNKMWQRCTCIRHYIYITTHTLDLHSQDMSNVCGGTHTWPRLSSSRTCLMYSMCISTQLLLQDLSNVDVQINVHKHLSGPRTAGGQRYATTKGGRCVPHDQNKHCVFWGCDCCAIPPPICTKPNQPGGSSDLWTTRQQDTVEIGKAASD